MPRSAPRRSVFALLLAALSLGFAHSAFAATRSETRPHITLPSQSHTSPARLVSPAGPPPLTSPAGGAPANPADPRDGIVRGAPVHRGPDRVDPAMLSRVLGVSIPEIGGDVVVFDSPTSVLEADIAIASNGDIYLAISYVQHSPEYDEWIDVHRSQDGGTTFQLFGTIHTLGDTAGQRLTRMIIAEGDQDRLFVQYRYLETAAPAGTRIECAYTSMTGSSATWNTRVVFDDPGAGHTGADLASDAVAFSGYYLYAVASGLDGNGDDIWFTRSTDFGDTWSAPYRIAEISSNGNLMYTQPKIAYGFGGALHVAWTYTDRTENLIDSAVYYRRALNYADGGLADWDPAIWALRPSDDGIEQSASGIAASTDGNEVVVLHSEGIAEGDPHVFYSTTAGADWLLADRADLPWDRAGTIHYRPSSTEFVAAGRVVGGADHILMSVAPEGDPGTWSPAQRFSDEASSGVSTLAPQIAFDPTHFDRVATVWPEPVSGDVLFDAEWRGDPGYPNLEAGFPVPLDIGSGSPPALVNIDQDPYLEIVFSDHNGNVQVYEHDGTPAPGWPRHIGTMPLRAPVAVGDLNGHGYPSIVAGTTSGQVYAMAPDGALLPGFPVDLGTGAPTYVSIGALDDSGERQIVACSGQSMYKLDGRGQVVSPSWLFAGPLLAPAAIGDVNNDGQVELVTVSGPAASGIVGAYFMHVLDPFYTVPDAYRSFTSNVISGAATLADIDQNGDLEIAVPTEEGQLYMLQGDGTDVAGWPWSNGTGLPVTSAAMAQFIGTTAPDVAVASQDWRVHVLFSNGTQQSVYPQNTGTGWWLYGAPIVDRTHRTSSNVIIGSRDQMGWSFDNVGGTAPGWPKNLGAVCEVSPASGDIDLDGSNEIVFVTATDLVVVDVGYPAQADPASRWPMFGYDPGRRGCLNCDDAIPVDVRPVGAPARVTFALGGPNPTHGPVEFRYGIPRDAAVELDVFDLSGRRVRTVLRREQPAGEYVAGFDGRDRAGRALADGLYFARLRVRGPGGNRAETRRFTVLH